MTGHESSPHFINNCTARKTVKCLAPFVFVVFLKMLFIFLLLGNDRVYQTVKYSRSCAFVMEKTQELMFFLCKLYMSSEDLKKIRQVVSDQKLNG